MRNLRLCKGKTKNSKYRNRILYKDLSVSSQMIRKELESWGPVRWLVCGPGERQQGFGLVQELWVFREMVKFNKDQGDRTHST